MDPALCTESSTLFWETVPFICRADDKDELSKHLIVRILLDQIHHEKVLKVCIFSEEDLLFLHSLEVTEDDYSRLKLDQGIFVDFGNFPQKLITLLRRCNSENSKFVAELKTLNGGSQSEVHFFEINDFNKLSHLKLTFRPGTDQSIKSFLAFRLEEVSANSKALQTRLDQSQADLESLKLNCENKEDLIRELKEKCETLILEAKSGERRLRLEMKEQSAQEKEQIRLQFEEEKVKVENKLRDQIETLIKRNEELEASNKRLLDEKYTLDSKCSELTHQLASCEGASIALRKEAKDLKDNKRKLESDKQQIQIELSQALAENKALSQKLHDVKDVIELQKGRIDDLNDSRETRERRCEELRNELAVLEKSKTSMNAKLEGLTSIAEKFALGLRSRKERISQQKAVMTDQEETIMKLQKELRELAYSKSQIECTLKSLHSENNAHLSEIGDLKNQLMKSSKLLQENDLMIRWLNDQMNNSRPIKSSSARPILPTPSQPLNAMGLKGGPTLLASPIDREFSSLSSLTFHDKIES